MGFLLAERKTQGTAYYKAKFYVEKLFEVLNLEAELLPVDGATSSDSADVLPFESKRAAMINVKKMDSDEPGEIIGVVGEFKNSVRKNFKLSDYLAGFELDFEKLAKYYQPTKKIDVSSVVEKRDLTLETEKTYGELIPEIKKALEKNNLTANITPLAIYQPEKIKHVSVHLEFKQKIDDNLMQELEKIK